MSVFKKFTDFCGGFAAFSAIFFLFAEFMEYSPKDEPESLLQKLKMFLSDEPQFEYRPYLLLIALLVGALVISLLLRKRPYLAFGVSVLPLAYAISMLDYGQIYEYPMLYVVLGAFFAMGNLWECVCLDREDGRQRSSLAVSLACALIAILSLAIYLRAGALIDVPMAEAKFFDRTLILAIGQNESFVIYRTVAIVFAVLCVIGFLLWELHYLNAIVAAVMMGYVLVLWCTDAFSVYGAVLPTCAVAIAIARGVVMLSCTVGKRDQRVQASALKNE